jgi:ubiquitin conjugation factor E4 B
MERANIMRHLLSDNTDPFNRQKLTPEMLVPQVQYSERARAQEAVGR